MARNLGFHRGFNLTRARLSSALRCIAQHPTATHGQLGECMGVNEPVSKGYVAWLLHTGLITAQNQGKTSKLSYQCTNFGLFVQQYDPNLLDLGTQWGLHYFLASEHNERSDAWYVFINQFLVPGEPFVSQQFKSYFMRVFSADAENRKALEQDPICTLYTYIKPESLGRLGILREDQGTLVGTRPNLPHVLVIGYLLLDWWQRHHDLTDTLRLSQLYQEPGSIGRICQADAQQVKQLVTSLTQIGLLNFSETQHEPVNRLYREPPHTLLAMYYQQR